MEGLILLEKYFLIFIIYSIGGWILEEIHCSIAERKIVNRGFLIGPVCPIYGFGGIAITLFLTEFIERPLVVFWMGILLAAFIEYMTSWVMEKVFNARWWDYSNQKLNLNGRICLKTLVPFGVFGLIVVYIINPFLFEQIYKIPNNTTHIISGILIAIILADFIISMDVVSKVTLNSDKIEEEKSKDDTDEITKKVNAELKQNFRIKRFHDAFPDFKTMSTKIKEVADKTAKKSKEVVEKTAQKSIEVVEKTAKKSKEVVEKTANKSKEVAENTVKKGKGIVKKRKNIVKKTNISKKEQQ